MRLKVVDDDAMKDAGTALQTAQAPVAPEPIPEPSPVPALPNPDVSHAQKLYVDDRARLANYEQGLSLLHNERENLVARFDLALADVEKRIRDHELCKTMSTASILTFEEAEGK